VRRAGALAALAAAAAAAAATALVRRRWFVVSVVGGSMLPALRNGDVVLARRVDPAAAQVGDVVIVEEPERDGEWRAAPARTPTQRRRWIVKRVAAVPGDPLPDGVPGTGAVPAGSLVVLGDNGGYDSREFGPLPDDRVLGVMVRALPALSRPDGFVGPDGAVLDQITGRMVRPDDPGSPQG
jgi:signal peptidase I